MVFPMSSQDDAVCSSTMTNETLTPPPLSLPCPLTHFCSPLHRFITGLKGLLYVFVHLDPAQRGEVLDYCMLGNGGLRVCAE